MEIISEIIQACATILASFISVGYLGKIVKKTAETHFFNYTDKKHNLHKMMRRAKKSITVIVNCGDAFLDTYYENLLHYIKNGVKINFLLLDIENYAYMDMYTTGKKYADYNALETSLKLLTNLQKKHPNEVEVKSFRYILTMSYIGIDLEQNLLDNSWSSTALIQVMSYQFNTHPAISPITHISPQAKEQFQIIVDSIFAIWDCGDVVNLDEYLTKVIEYKKDKALDVIV